jgi:iron-sulfur cluster repair protein YtfE (RIC family)
MAELTSLSRTHPVLCGYMMHSHEHLHALYTRLLSVMEADAPREVQALWCELDHELLAHMEAEERFVLPAFAKVDHAEALAILREHGQARELLFDLGVAVDLHCLRYERSAELIHLLIHHAEREERLLYRWADRELSAETVEAVKRHLSSP